MPLNLSIKNVLEPVVVRLRERAKHNHRFLQGELLAILEGAAEPSLVSQRQLAPRIGASVEVDGHLG